jgi:hypothetical protein
MKYLLIFTMTIMLLFLASSSSDVFAQVQVNVQPFKNSHHIDESNYLTVKINKVVPNTDFCLQTSQHGNVKNYVLPIDLNFLESNLITGHTQKISLPNNFKTGYYDSEVFYGHCSSKDSFGSDSARIFFDIEPSRVAKFIQDNYFPEKIDVGLVFEKDTSFRYPIDFCYYDKLELCGDVVVSQKWSKTDKNFIEITITNSKFEFKTPSHEDLKKYIMDEISDEFQCNNNSNAHICYNSNFVIHVNGMGFNMHDPAIPQTKIFKDVIINKINSKNIPTSTTLSSMYPTSFAAQPDSTDPSDKLLPICGQGTVENNGQCFVDPNYDTRESLVPEGNFFDSLIKMFSSWFG